MTDAETKPMSMRTTLLIATAVRFDVYAEAEEKPEEIRAIHREIAAAIRSLMEPAPPLRPAREVAHEILDMHVLVAGMRRGDYCAEDWHCAACDRAVDSLERDRLMGGRVAAGPITNAGRALAGRLKLGKYEEMPDFWDGIAADICASAGLVPVEDVARWLEVVLDEWRRMEKASRDDGDAVSTLRRQVVGTIIGGLINDLRDGSWRADLARLDAGAKGPATVCACRCGCNRDARGIDGLCAKCEEE